MLSSTEKRPVEKKYSDQSQGLNDLQPGKTENDVPSRSERYLCTHLSKEEWSGECSCMTRRERAVYWTRIGNVLGERKKYQYFPTLPGLRHAGPFRPGFPRTETGGTSDFTERRINSRACILHMSCSDLNQLLDAWKVDTTTRGSRTHLSQNVHWLYRQTRLGGRTINRLVWATIDPWSQLRRPLTVNLTYEYIFLICEYLFIQYFHYVLRKRLNIKSTEQCKALN